MYQMSDYHQINYRGNILARGTKNESIYNTKHFTNTVEEHLKKGIGWTYLFSY